MKHSHGCNIAIRHGRHCKLPTYHHHSVETIKARGGEVVVEVICFKPRETIELVLRPLPDVAIDVMKSQCIGWIHVDTLQQKKQ